MRGARQTQEPRLSPRLLGRRYGHAAGSEHARPEAAREAGGVRASETGGGAGAGPYRGGAGPLSCRCCSLDATGALCRAQGPWPCNTDRRLLSSQVRASSLLILRSLHVRRDPGCAPHSLRAFCGGGSGGLFSPWSWRWRSVPHSALPSGTCAGLSLRCPGPWCLPRDGGKVAIHQKSKLPRREITQQLFRTSRARPLSSFSPFRSSG